MKHEVDILADLPAILPKRRDSPGRDETEVAKRDIPHQVRSVQQGFFKSTQSDLKVLLRLANGGVVVRHVADYWVAPDGGRKLNFVRTKVDPGVHLRG